MNHYLGRYILGQVVPLFFWSRNGSGTPTAPADAPLATIYDSSGNTVLSLYMPIADQANTTGFFEHLLSLDSRFSVGYYDCVITASVSGTSKVAVVSFQIVAGGNVDGSGIAMHYFNSPHRDFLLLQTDTGILRKLRNPRLT